MPCLCWIKNTFEVAFFCVAFVCVVANFISWSPMTSLSHKGLVTFYTTVEWSIPNSPLSPLINKWVRIENKFPIIPLYSAWSIKPWLIGGGGVVFLTFMSQWVVDLKMWYNKRQENLTTFWHLRSITVQTQGNMESICFIWWKSKMLIMVMSVMHLSSTTSQVRTNPNSAYHYTVSNIENGKHPNYFWKGFCVVPYHN